jgi:hypothetical protein
VRLSPLFGRNGLSKQWPYRKVPVDEATGIRSCTRQTLAHQAAHTSMHVAAPHSQAMQPHQRLQHASQQPVLQLPRSRATSRHHAASIIGHRPPLPQCSAYRQHAPSAAASYSAARLRCKRHARGWSKYQQRNRRGGVVAASDDDDSSALSIYSSSGAHLSQSHTKVACELLKTEPCQQGCKKWVCAEVRWGSRIW